ncbi:slo-interacting protein 1 isoform X2 [Drosophila eugracilis]|uniref:slo-interacting protein 1 isoform X2 n=1 Tax=Drosophila eugracilis TaxID=29029 RepID=UPI0007E5CC24|nr:slo-interacting protein 1 isoform X2 [Drosophila eugracilis]
MNECIVEVEYQYVVLKVNGFDISNMPRYEAVQKFLQAKETLVVELCRQKHNALGLQEDAYTEQSDANKTVPNVLQLKNSELENATSESVTKISSASQPVKVIPAQPTTNSASEVTGTKSPIVLTLRALGHEEGLESCTVLAASKETQTLNSVDSEVLRDSDMVQTIADHFIEQEHHLFEQCLEPDIDFEEVTLIKAVENSTSDQIGLIVCSSGFQSSNIDANKGDILCTDLEQGEDVFISGIQLHSIAHRDGRLRQGDQILRINGMDVKNQEEVETQIAESTTSVTLLVSRILYPEDEDDEDINFDYANSFLPDDYTNVVDKLDRVLLNHVQSMEDLSKEDDERSDKYHLPSEQHPLESNVRTSSLPKKIIDQTSEIKLHSDACRDHRKSLNRSLTQNQINLRYEYDESEHIYETIPEDFESEPLYCSPYQSSNGKTSMGSCSTEIASTETTMQQQTHRVAQWLGLKPQYPKTLVGRPPLKLTQQPTCSRVFTLRSTLTNTSGSSSSGVAYSADGPNNIVSGNMAPGEELDNSSSAYNTGGSNNSASPHQNTKNVNDIITVSHKLENTEIDGPKGALDSTAINSMLLIPFGKSGRIGLCSSNLPTAYVSERQRKVAYENENHQPKNHLKLLTVKPTEAGNCPEFNAPNLSSYQFVSSQEVTNRCQSFTSQKQNTENSDEIPMVWKVKRRPDGTRYIVKRPVRNRTEVGFRRSMRFNELTTTEEDTVSEVKIGRYWTKEERKRHIERARERRHLQTQQQQQ